MSSTWAPDRDRFQSIAILCISPNQSECAYSVRHYTRDFVVKDTY